ncbi:hypothetical protein HPY31_17205 [Brevibacillus sp. HB1.3]|uniref:hypothetical protein n=1 Tax=Brevibacillus sp. HB1.3 TaxID=2738842 RepID=UPI0015550BFE|nr:hypothetical protein [Brevibacillus sp. HB1.3]NQF15650.1 hypothetical protein [Brevibacillus sp. HB1.3]
MKEHTERHKLRISLCREVIVIENSNKNTTANSSVDTMKEAIVVGESYHFWLDAEEDVYDQKYNKLESEF